MAGQVHFTCHACSYIAGSYLKNMDVTSNSVYAVIKLERTFRELMLRDPEFTLEAEELFQRTDLVVLFFTITAMGIALSSLTFIVQINMSESCSYLSRQWAYFSNITALAGTTVNFAFLYIRYIQYF